jgi:hypothetical protein
VSTAAWVLSGPLPCGARKLGPAHSKHTDWTEVNILGQHLPQMYPEAEVHPLRREDCPGLGLCEDCLGFGVLGADSPTAQACPGCSGSGRPALRVVVKRTAEGGISVDARPVPHAYTPPADPEQFTAWAMAPETCLACGLPRDGKGPRGQALHPDE